MQGGENEIRIVITGDNTSAMASIRQVIEATAAAQAQATQIVSGPLSSPGAATAASKVDYKSATTEAKNFATANTSLSSALDKVNASGAPTAGIIDAIGSAAATATPNLDATDQAIRRISAALSQLSANRSGMRALTQISSMSPLVVAGGGTAGGGAPGGAGGGTILTPTPPIVTGGGGRGAPPVIPPGGVNPVNPQAVQNARGLDLSLLSIAGRVAQFKIINDIFTGVADSIGYAAGESIKFQTNIQKITALTTVSKQEANAFGKEVRSLALEGPSSANELAESLYNATSSGLEGAKAMEVLKAANMGAAAGMGDVTDITKILTATMNAYGPAVGDAVKITDQFTMAAKLGSAEAGEYAKHLGQVIPIAAQAGVSLANVLAFVATGTNKGISTPQVATGTRALLENLIQPDKQARDAMRKIGVNRDDIKEGMQGDFATFMSGLIKKAEANGGGLEDVSKIIPNIRALSVSLASVGPDGGDAYISNMKAIETANGTTADSSKAFADNVERAGGRVKAAWAEIGIEIGEAVNPKLADMLDYLTNILKAFNNLPKGAMKGIEIPDFPEGDPRRDQAATDKANLRYVPTAEATSRMRSDVTAPELPEWAPRATYDDFQSPPYESYRRGTARPEQQIAPPGSGADTASSFEAQAYRLNNSDWARKNQTSMGLVAAQGDEGFIGPKLPAPVVAPVEPEPVVSSVHDLTDKIKSEMDKADLAAYMNSEAEKAMEAFGLAVANGEHSEGAIKDVATWAANVKRGWRRNLELTPAEAESRSNSLDAMIYGTPMEAGAEAGQAAQKKLTDLWSGYQDTDDKNRRDKHDEQERERAKRKAEQDARDAERRTRTATRGFTEGWADESGRRSYQDQLGVEGAKTAQAFDDAYTNAADFEGGAMDKGKAVATSIKRLTDEAKKAGIPEWKELGDLVGSAMLTALEAKLSGDPMAGTFKTLAMDALNSMATAVKDAEAFSSKNVLGGKGIANAIAGSESGPALGIFQSITAGQENPGITAQKATQSAVASVLSELNKLKDRDLAVGLGRDLLQFVADGIDDGSEEAQDAMRQGIIGIMDQAKLSAAAHERDKQVTEANKQYDIAIQQIERDRAVQLREEAETKSTTRAQEREMTGKQREFEDIKVGTSYGRESESIDRQRSNEDEERQIQRRESRQTATLMREVQYRASQRATLRQQAREDEATGRSRAFEDSEAALGGPVDPKQQATLVRRRAFEDNERKIQREEAKKETELQKQEETQQQNLQNAIQDKQQDSQLARQRTFQDKERAIRTQQQADDLVTQRTNEDTLLGIRQTNEDILEGLRKRYEGERLENQKTDLATTRDETIRKAKEAYDEIQKQITDPFYDQLMARQNTQLTDLETRMRTIFQFDYLANILPGTRSAGTAPAVAPGDAIDAAIAGSSPSRGLGSGDVKLTVNMRNDGIIAGDAGVRSLMGNLQAVGAELLDDAVAVSGGHA